MRQKNREDTIVVATANNQGETPKQQNQHEEPTKQKELMHKTYDYVTLDVMLDEMAKFYGVSVEYHNAEAKQLRFYYDWNSHDDFKKVLDELSHLQQMSMSLVDNKIILPNDTNSVLSIMNSKILR